MKPIVCSIWVLFRKYAAWCAQHRSKEDRQTLLFSATFTDDIIRLSEQWTDKPVKLEMEPERVATDTVEQKIFITTASEKFALLKNILRSDDVDSVMVFANRRDICRTLYERLKKQGFKVGLIAGDVPQARRMKTLEAFKSGCHKGDGCHRCCRVEAFMSMALAM